MVVASLLFACAPSSPEPGTPTWLVEALGNRVADNGGYGGGLVRLRTGDQIFEVTDGQVERGGDDLEADHLFDVASTSKAFTAAAVLLLVQEGLVGLDDPIDSLLSAAVLEGLLVIDGVDRSGEITVRQLLQHTSGLPDYWYDPPYQQGQFNAFLVAYDDDPGRSWEPTELLAYARDLDPIGPPGGQYHYSDTGYVLAGLIVEDLTGKSLHTVIRGRILEVLAMEHSFLPFREDPALGVRSHRYEGDWDMTGPRHQTADWAGGGYVSSLADLDAFVSGLIRGELVDPSLVDEMMRTVPVGEVDVAYGLGLFSLELDDGLGTLWGHDGYGNAFMYYWPERDTSMVGTLNQTENDWWPVVARGITEVARDAP